MYSPEIKGVFHAMVITSLSQSISIYAMKCYTQVPFKMGVSTRFIFMGIQET